MTPDEVRLAIEHYYHLLRDADTDFNLSAARTGQHEYMYGTFIGVCAVAIECALIAFIAWTFWAVSVRDERFATALACAIAGGFGATASVSWRVSLGDFVSVNPGASVVTLRRLGRVRPVVGAVFGVALYFALKSGFIDIGESNSNFYFFAFMAFLAGFSERAVPELLRTAEKRLSGDERPAPTGPDRRD